MTPLRPLLDEVADAFLSARFFMRNHLFNQWELSKIFPQKNPALMTEKTAEFQFYFYVLSRTLTNRVHWGEVWDIGCRGWSYAPALAAFFPEARLLGVEVDPGQRYWNLKTRGEHAQFQVSGLQQQGRQAAFYGQDFRIFDFKSTASKSRDSVLFCHFFPFVSERPCRKWGLPSSFCDFEGLLKKSLSHPTNQVLGIFSLHQGGWELELAQAHYHEQGLDPQVTEFTVPEFEQWWPVRFSLFALYAERQELPQSNV